MGRKEDLDNRVDVDKMASILARFFGGDEDKARNEINRLLKGDPSLTRGNIFNEVSSGRGKPTTHMSGFTEGELLRRVPFRKQNKRHY